jgi:UDP-glucose 4-epimerase
MTSSPSLVIFGGAGYIGSNLAVSLKSSHKILIVDKAPEPEWFTSVLRSSSAQYLQLDLTSTVKHDLALSSDDKHRFAIILAARKDVAEGEQLPYEYARDNITITINCLEYCERWGIRNIILGSSCTVYHTGKNARHCFSENDANGEPLGVYGYTKKATEDIVKVLTEKKPDVSVAVLRYANPVASISGVSLFPGVGVMSVLGSRHHHFVQRGDGTRDYINIRDMVEMHRLLLTNWEEKIRPQKFIILNIGTGISTRTSTLVDLFMKVNEEEAVFHYPKIERVQSEQFEALSACVDMMKFRSLFEEWVPRYSVKDSVRDYVRRFPLPVSSLLDLRYTE